MDDPAKKKFKLFTYGLAIAYVVAIVMQFTADYEYYTPDLQILIFSVVPIFFFLIPAIIALLIKKDFTKTGYKIFFISHLIVVLTFLVRYVYLALIPGFSDSTFFYAIGIHSQILSPGLYNLANFIALISVVTSLVRRSSHQKIR